MFSQKVNSSWDITITSSSLSWSPSSNGTPFINSHWSLVKKGLSSGFLTKNPSLTSCLKQTSSGSTLLLNVAIALWILYSPVNPGLLSNSWGLIL